jgi:hypothetical protein
MKFKSAAAGLTAAFLLAGCASTTVSLSSTNSPSLVGAPAPGVAYSSGYIHADVTAGTFLGFALLAYLLAGAQNDYQRWIGGASWREVPGLAEDRAIAERDCSQPLDQLYANLRCK